MGQSSNDLTRWQPGSLETLRNHDDLPMAIMLTEYEHVREVRAAHVGNAFSQVGQLFLAASIAIAATATLVGVNLADAGIAGAVTITATGAIVLVLGSLVFSRLLTVKIRRYEYNLYLAAIREYFVVRAPTVESYILQARIYETGRFRPRYGVLHLIALSNSTLVGLGVGATVWILDGPILSAIAVGSATAIFFLMCHSVYGSSRIDRTQRGMRSFLDSRGLLIETARVSNTEPQRTSQQGGDPTVGPATPTFGETL